MYRLNFDNYTTITHTNNYSNLRTSKLQKTIVPGQDYSGESLEVRRVCAAVHTAEAITNYRNSL